VDLLFAALPEIHSTFMNIEVFMGSHVVQGSGLAVVTASGANTKLAAMIHGKKFPPKNNSTEYLLVWKLTFATPLQLNSTC
jgi:magnesium-transporting ATPase (P-type)